MMYFRKRTHESEWDKERAGNCEAQRDNFTSNSSDTDQEYSLSQSLKKACSSCKHSRVVLKNAKREVSIIHETEASSTSGVTVDSAACSADHSVHNFPLLADKIIKLDIDDLEFITVRKKFYTGLGMLASYTTIKGIFKNCHKGTNGMAQLQAFNRQEEITTAIRGNANVRYGWHGTSKPGVTVTVLHGFGPSPIPRHGAVYGIGVYLAPEDYSNVSAVYSDVDENGEQHMVLCRVIMGNMELVEHGSEQFHPKSEEFDTGVDDICNPKCYIVWSTHMNTHILPEYVISFKLPPPWNEIIARVRGNHSLGRPVLPGEKFQLVGGLPECCTSHQKHSSTCNSEQEPMANENSRAKKYSRDSHSPWMSFPSLFHVMKTKASKEQMCKLQNHYLQFKVGKMSRNEFIGSVRNIAGDRLLAVSIRIMQDQERASNIRREKLDV
ncbi:hypothetical protein KP509_29G059600 [Ceratopteris richardii]|uniref:PARP n=1 Tax=Ceratopteris richardii TaxID=49495 RepID=A0A8T2R7D7_CERRI|nr:hypothetical protein KP509_29G059600 [Ceratopteris richardii]